MSTPPPVSTGLLIFLAHRHYESRIVDQLRAKGFAITIAQARLAARIADEGSRLTDLAESAQVTKQTAGFLVDQLERAGYVERRPDRRDARVRLIRLAERGLQLQRVARAMERTLDAEWERHLGATRMAALREALVALRPLVDPYLDDAGADRLT